MQNSQNSEYWKRRQIREAFNVFADAETTADEISKLYSKASVYIDSRIKGIFDKFKRKYGLSDAEAKRILEAASDRGSIDAALKALQNGFQTDSVKEIRQVIESAAYSARIQKLRELEISAEKVMSNLYKQELAKHTAFYKILIRDSYRRSIYNIQQRAGIAFSFSDVNPKLIDRLLHSKWSGKNYSARLWDNTKEVAESVKEEIILGALTGKTEREMSEALNEKFIKGARASRRLIRTESNYIFTQADMAARKDCDIRKYMYLATLDMKTCAETCGKLDGKIFLVKDQKPGYNCPPMHPWCRCTTLSILSEDWIKTQTRRARDPETGKTYRVPLSMTYEEWKKKYFVPDKYIKENAIDENIGRESGITNKKSAKQEAYKINRNYIQSNEYKRKFNGISGNSEVDNEIYKCSKAALIHRDGTDREDLYIISASSGKVLGKNVTSTEHKGVSPNDSVKTAVRENVGDAIGLHTHFDDTPPTGSDFEAAYKRRYQFGVVANATGDVYKYGCGGKYYLKN